MFIAHLPAGYLLARVIPYLHCCRGWVLAGAVLPDLDMLYFHLVDGARVHHHLYLTHRPLLWIVLLAVGVTLTQTCWGRRLCGLGAGGVLHMVLDTPLGAIAWGWPYSDDALALIEIPARYDWWVVSFLTHWSFAAEVLICLVCWVFWRRDRPVPHYTRLGRTMQKPRRGGRGFDMSRDRG